MNATPEQAGGVAALAGKTAVVTGATSGIGRGCALALARAGAFVFVTGRNTERGAESVSQISAAGGQAEFQSLDVTAEADWLRVMAAVKARFGRLDILVNNAGDVGFSPLEQTPLEKLNQYARINMEGPFLGMTTAWPLMKRRGGAIINIVSTAGQGGLPMAVAYTGSKGGLTGLTKAAAADGRSHGIRVNSIHPGAIWTEGLAAMMKDTLEGYTAKMKQSRTTPIGRPGLPADVGAVVVFLASDGARHITGVEFNIDGGLGAR